MTLPQWVETLRQDSRLALRLMRRSPIFFGASILTLALGIGANGAVFSILQSVLLRPLPYDEASRVVLLWHAGAESRRWSDRLVFSGPLVMSVRDAAAGQFGEVAAAQVMHTGGQLNAGQGDLLESALDLSIGDRTIRLNGASVTPNFFRVLGVRAAMGRVFGDADDGTSEASIILSDATWRRDFGADPKIVGRPVTIAAGVPRVSRTFTVAGVLPRGVHFTYPDEVEAWVMLSWSAVQQSNPYGSSFRVVARLRRGLATSDASRVLSSMPLPPLVAPADAVGEQHDRVGLTTMRDWIVGDTRPSLFLLAGVAALLLLVTCVTVSNGLLARISERQQELAVRSALGAERSRVVQQLLVEGSMLAVAGTIAGIVLAVLIQPLLRALLPGSLPQVDELRVNGSIVAFGAVMAAVTTILAAVAPAWSGTQQDASGSLTRAASGGTATWSAVRWRYSLVGAQAALTTMLLIFSTLLLTSLWRLGQVSLGFDPHDVVAVDLQLLDSKYGAPGAMIRFQEGLVRGVRAIPGIDAAGLTSAIPFRGFDSPGQIDLPGGNGKEIVRVRRVDSAYFAALRVPLLRGRLLTSADREGSAAVVVISESFARTAFGSTNPIGRTLALDRPTEIVGIVGDLRYAAVDKDPAFAIYVPTAQNPRPLFTLVVRAKPTLPRREVIDGIRRVLHDLDPQLPALHVATVDRVVDATIAGRRFYSVATSAFAVIALVLTTVGLALVVARVVAERRRELAVRAALGATLTRLAHAAVGKALIAIASGVVVGLLLAGIGSVLLAQFLFQIAPRSPAAYAGAAMFVVAASGMAAWLPMRRFAAASLADMLRSD